MREVQLKSSEKLKIIQAMSGVTQEVLAQQFGVSFVTLNSWINNRSEPRKRKSAEIDEQYREFTGQNVITEDKLQTYYRELIGRRDEVFLSQNVDSFLKLLKLRQDLVADLILRLTYSSNKIEGSTLTLPEVREVLANGVLPVDKSVVEVLEAKNHQQALKMMFRSLAERKFSLSLDFIGNLHKILMHGIWDNAGVWRQHPVRILGSNVVTANWVKVPDLMNDFELRLQAWSDLSGYEAVVEAYALHAVFEKIHPFPDGNGRVGRILLYAMLLKLNLPPVYIVPEERNFYYTYLAKAQNDGEYSQLLKFLFLSTMNGFEFFS